MIFYYDCHGIRTGKKEGEYISMHTRTLNDQQILAKLAKSPQQGLALLMEQYTGLIWHIAASHLHNPEDIKECVNETFARFYFQREKYDPEKASLTLYLASITRNLAISRYRKEQVSTPPYPEQSHVPAPGLPQEKRLAGRAFPARRTG